MEGMKWLPVGAIAACLGATVPWTYAQSTQATELAAGKLLVASPDLPDPNFAKTVVLLIQYDDDGVVGLILNRRSKVPISRVLDELAGAKTRPDPVYAGGPVGRSDVLALVRSAQAPGEAKRVFGDVYLVSSKDALEKTFASATESDRLRVYMGYSGWTARQLENELDLGAWYIFQGSVKAVFDSNPDGLWPRLIRETEMRIAMRRTQRGLFSLTVAAGVLPRPD